jgi:preprotein translocase subunit SecF
MINFIKYRLVYFVLSLVVIGLGFYYLLAHGFVYSVDFIGGGLIEFNSTSKQAVKAEELVEKKYPNLVFQKTGTGFFVKSSELDKNKADKVAKEIVDKFKVQKTRYELVGPSVSSANVYKIITASVLAILGILIYVATQFKNWRFGVAAVLALLHDTAVLVGVWAILGYYWAMELDVLFVTAVLTTMSFSVHDTIVIFDKIQEEESSGRFNNLTDRINWALNVTMMRSLNNSLTVVIMLSALIILGGESTKGFAISLLIGTITGTYSSPFVATPIYFSLAKKT